MYCTFYERVKMRADQHIFFFGFFVFQILFLAVVVGHGDDGQDEVDQVERAHEDDDDEKQHV